MTMPQPSTGQASSTDVLARFATELQQAMIAHETRLQETSEIDDISVAIRRRSEEARNEIASALSRIEDGSFGTCEGCLTGIGSDRLEAMPHTRYCLGCATMDRAITRR